VTLVTSEYNIVTSIIDLSYMEDGIGSGALTSFTFHQFPAVVGDTWLAGAMADGQLLYTAEVISTSESVTVAAGTYNNVIHVRYTAIGGLTLPGPIPCTAYATLEGWNASGVGVIKFDSQMLVDIPGPGQMTILQTQEVYQVIAP
jgi:hypothetical protein